MNADTFRHFYDHHFHENRRELLYLALFASVVLLLAVAAAAGAWYALPRLAEPRVQLALDDYPPSDTPYLFPEHDFWLVNALEGELFAFNRVSPPYADEIAVDECRYDWNPANGRFIDPCSGDEWELDGRLNRRQSTELWSQRDLGRYALAVEDRVITVYLERAIPGTARGEEAPSARRHE